MVWISGGSTVSMSIEICGHAFPEQVNECECSLIHFDLENANRETGTVNAVSSACALLNLDCEPMIVIEVDSPN